MCESLVGVYVTVEIVCACESADADEKVPGNPLSQKSYSQLSSTSATRGGSWPLGREVNIYSFPI